MHLAHPLGVKGFAYRRVKNDERDAADLADLLRMGRLPEAWIAPPATRELRELVRHRAKLVAMRTALQGRGARGAGQGRGRGADDRPVRGGGQRAAGRATSCRPAYAARIASLRRLIEAFDFEIDVFARLVQGRLAADPGYSAVQTIPGVGPVLAAVFVAEIGDVTGSPGPAQLACWAGLTPRHHESDTTVHRGRITKQGSRLVRWAAVEAVQDAARIPAPSGAIREQVARPPRPQHRRGGRRPAAARAGLLRAARPPRPRAGSHARPRRREPDRPDRPARVVQVMTPDSRRGRPF